MARETFSDVVMSIDADQLEGLSATQLVAVRDRICQVEKSFPATKTDSDRRQALSLGLKARGLAVAEAGRNA